MSVRDDDSEQGQEHKGGLAAVGSHLARERKKQQRNLESVASDLHLRPEIVRAIENGDEAALPTTAFVRGYVKSYARLLGLEDGALLAQLPGLDEHRPLPLKSVGMRRRGVSLPIGKWLLWAMVLAALSLVIIYGVPTLERLWSARTGEPVSDQLQLPIAGQEQEEATRLLPLPDEPPPVEEAGVVDEETGGAVESEVSEPVVEQEPEKEQPAPVPETLTQPAPPETLQDASEPAGPALVTMRFNEDSWVEMEAHGRKLVVGTQRAGSERTVRAEPPIQLLLGNAPGVELTYRGEIVDMTPYRRGKVARLTLED